MNSTIVSVDKEIQWNSYLHSSLHIYIHINICVCVCMSACVYVCVIMYTHTHIHDISGLNGIEIEQSSISVIK